MVHSSEERADFVAGVFAPKGAGHTRRWSPEVDSRLGVQLVGAVTSRLSATVQMISEQNHDGSYEPRVEWANIKYQFTPKLSLRVGRTALASFLVADFRKVGYANTSVRPPEEVYGIVPISSSDGVDASYRGRVGSFDHTLLVGYGQADARPAEGGPVRARDQLILSDTVEAGPVTFRIAYVKSRLDIDTLQGLFAGFRQFGAQGIALADRYDTNDRRVEFVALGGLYDAGDWFVTAEWGTARLNSALGDRAGWYVSGGYRIGNITPYATYARSRSVAVRPAAAVRGHRLGTQRGTQRSPGCRSCPAGHLRRRALGLHAEFRRQTPVRPQESGGQFGGYARESAAGLSAWRIRESAQRHHGSGLVTDTP
jgi:hypothetical protein